MDEELDPLGYGNLPRIEHGAGQWPELPSACPASVDADPRFLLKSVFGKARGPAMRARFRRDGVYQRDFLLRRIAVLGVVPLRNGRNQKRAGFPCARKFALQGVELFFVHGGGRRFRRAIGGPPQSRRPSPSGSASKLPFKSDDIIHRNCLCGFHPLRAIKSLNLLFVKMPTTTIIIFSLTTSVFARTLGTLLHAFL